MTIRYVVDRLKVAMPKDLPKYGAVTLGSVVVRVKRASALCLSWQGVVP